METTSQIRINNLQFAIFFNGLDLSNKLKIVQKAIETSENLLDGDPIMLPIPDDAPADIPRIILKSKDNKVALNISINRMDLQLSLDTESDIKVQLEDLSKSYERYMEMMIKIAQNLNIKVNKLGAVVISKYTIQEELSKWFNAKFNLSRTDSLDYVIAFRSIIQSNSININYWRKYETIPDLSNLLSESKEVSILLDYNTSPSLNIDLEEENIKTVLMDIKEHLFNNFESIYS